ncbi:Protocadherin gamma-A7, partial [Lamprotornis superbus]
YGYAKQGNYVATNKNRLGPGGGRALLGALLLCVWWRAAGERLRYAIAEELGRGSLVGPLARDLGLSADELPARKLQVASAGKKQLQYFTVNEENGNLYVNERLDREEMCGESATCSVSFEALVHNPLNVFHVEVAIEDVNDNSPTFSKAVLDLEIGELIPPGARFPLEMARDADAGSNSLLTYQLTSNPSFSLSMKEKPGGKKQPELVLERVLDREKQSSFELVLMAVDGGDPPRSGTVQIRVNVTDANDNPPVFSKSLYEARVAENLPVESLVLRVRATDADAGSNGRVSYSFGSVPDAIRALFAVDSETGEIRTAGPLDFEENSKYTFGLEATDGGGLTDHCEVQIDITDENDNAPDIMILSLSSPVPEDAPVGTVVAVLNVNDPDSGENGQVSCELSGEAPLSIVASPGGSYKVVTASALDREQASEHRVTVVTRDRGRPALSASTELVLEVSDRALLWAVLLAAWEAAWGQLRYSVPEEMPKGSFVGDVAKDLGLQLTENGDQGVRNVSEGRTQYFGLHGKTGHLVTAERIDREQLCESVQQCLLRCELIVEGEMQVYGIQVEITDINDNPPSFRDADKELKMSEMTAPGSRFPLAQAHDPDSGRNSLQSYELSGDEHFSLAVQAGPGGDQRPELVLAKALDREEAAFHELVLRAMDGGDPARTGTARIRVIVVDANDNAPVFRQAEYTVRVPEDVPVGSTLITVQATDADEGLNGEVEYSFKKITEKSSQIFQLDSDTGAISLLQSLDFEKGDSYELEVQAHDGGGLFDTTKVVITVTDVNDNVPEISVRSALSEISEDAPSGTVVALLHVRDKDSGANGEVRCSLDGGVPFRLEKSYDDYYRVVTARELDREQVSEYNLTVRAADGGSPSLQSSAVLALRVLDVNDNAPVFLEERYSARLAENNAAGALVL